MPSYSISSSFTFETKLFTKIFVFNFALFLSLIFRSSKANSVAFISNLQTVNACDIVNCGQGTCRETDSSVFGFECDCNSGWKKFQIDSFALPPCIIPDCTLNLGCGTGSPSPPAPPEPVFNWADPCTYTWCGDGSCKSNGTGYECNCSAGSDDLLNKTALPCFQECSLGADCHRPVLRKPPPSSHGLRELKKASLIGDGSALLIFAALFLPLLQ